MRVSALGLRGSVAPVPPARYSISRARVGARASPAPSAGRLPRSSAAPGIASTTLARVASLGASSPAQQLHNNVARPLPYHARTPQRPCRRRDSPPVASGPPSAHPPTPPDPPRRPHPHTKLQPNTHTDDTPTFTPPAHSGTRARTPHYRRGHRPSVLHKSHKSL